MYSSSLSDPLLQARQAGTVIKLLGNGLPNSPFGGTWSRVVPGFPQKAHGPNFSFPRFLVIITGPSSLFACSIHRHPQRSEVHPIVIRRQRAEVSSNRTGQTAQLRSNS